MKDVERAIELVNAGEVDEALSVLTNFLKEATDEERFAVADLYYGWGFIDEAIQIVEQLLHTYPTEGQLITKLASMYIDVEKDDKAIELLNNMAEEDPYYVQALLQLADLYEVQGLYEVAEQKLFEAKQLEQDEKIIDFALAELLFSTGQYNRAIPFYERVSDSFTTLNDVAITERLAECHAFLGHYEQAFQYYEENDHDHPDTLFKYGYTAKQHGKEDVAIRVWRELIELDPHYYAVYPLLAETLLEKGLEQDAIRVIEKGLMYNDFHKELLVMAADLAWKENEIERAKEHIEQAIDIDIDYKEAVLLYVDILKTEDEYEQIAQFISFVKEQGANDPVYDWELAKAYEQLEEYEKALEAYEEASAHLQHDSLFLKQYGYFLTEEGKIEQALEVFEMYMKLEPFDEETKQFIERLNFSNND